MKLLRDLSKRFVVLVMIFTMLVGLSQFGVYSNAAIIVPETGITQTFDLSNGSVTIDSPGTYVITQSIEGVTRNIVTINSNATIYLSGVNIEVLKPSSISDYSKPNPININGSFTVDLYLVDGSTNKLASEEGTIVSDGWVRNGSGKAALRVPEGSTLNIYGNTGILNATGAQGKNHAGFAARGGGGAAIGGDGGIEYSTEHYYEPAEASGIVNIYGGIIEAVGGAAMGHHGYGGNAIGSGGLEYNGTPVLDGAVSLYGGYVYLTGGLGTWSKCSGYAIRGDLHFYGGKLVAKSAPEGNTICSPLSRAPLTYSTQYSWRINPLDLMELSYVSTYTFADTQRYVEIQEDFSGPYYINLAKTAAQNADYLDTTQAVATSETIIKNTLKEVAELAINDETITVTVNRISYALPTAGTSANPTGSNGSYAFTITVTQGEYTQTTDEDSIAIIATAFDGVSDVDMVLAAQNAAQAASYLDTTQAIATTETIIKDALKEAATLAIDDDSITVTVNMISYIYPIAGTPTTPAGIDGSYTFTITVSKGEQALTTEEKTIIIKATHTELFNPDVIVEQDLNDYEFNASGLDNVVVFSDEERVHEVFVKLVFSVLARTDIPMQDKTLIDNFIKDVLGYNKSEIFVVDISLFKMVGETSTPITNTPEAVAISFILPVAFRDVEFDLVRVHGDEVEVLEYIIDEETFVITFTSSKFSTFSLVSELEDELVLPETSDGSKMFNWLLMLLGVSLLLFGLGFDKKDNK